MKDYLKKLRKRCEQKVADTRTAMRASDSADEVRSLGETLDTLAAELKELDEKLAELEGEGEGEGEDPGAAGEGADSEASRSTQMNPMATYGNLRTVASFQVGEQRSAESNDDPFATLAYRQAFHQLVTRRTPLPEQHRAAVNQALSQSRAADAVTLTSDTTAVIPTTLVQDIISKADTCGNVWAKTTKTNIQGGVEIPIMDLKPSATWIGEGEVSKDQKLSATDKVVFTYHGLECRIAQSILVSVVTIDAFEKKFVELGTEAMVKAMEAAVVNGDGLGKMLGITEDPRIKNIITLAPKDFTSWEGWQKKVIAKIPKA
ncbi:MAG: phage major capsid protein, partial [Gordonibacter sp.]